MISLINHEATDSEVTIRMSGKWSLFRGNERGRSNQPPCFGAYRPTTGERKSGNDTANRKLYGKALFFAGIKSSCWVEPPISISSREDICIMDFQDAAGMFHDERLFVPKIWGAG